MRRGIEAPDLHPEAIFPGSFLPHRGSLPWFWSWIRPFPPSPHGCTTQPRAGLLLSGEQKSRAKPSTQKGSLAAAQVPSRQVWLPVYQLPGRAIELGGLKQCYYCVPLVRSNPYLSRGFWGCGRESKAAEGKLHQDCRPLVTAPQTG